MGTAIKTKNPKLTKASTTTNAAYAYKKLPWSPPGLEEVVPFWLPDPWNCWMAPAEVTADMAKAWLGLNVANNRNVIDSLVEQVFYDLVNGSWRATHQGIAFNQDNSLFDGQNRLIDYYKEVYPLPESVEAWEAKGMPRAGRLVMWPQKGSAA